MGYLFDQYCYPDENSLYQAIVQKYRVYQVNPDGTTQFTLIQVPNYGSQTIIPFGDSPLGYRFDLFFNVRILNYDQQGNIIASYPSSTNYYTWQEILFQCDQNYTTPTPMNITLQNPPDNFNPSNLNPVDVFNSIGSGFLLVAVPLAVVWAGRHFLRPLFSK